MDLGGIILKIQELDVSDIQMSKGYAIICMLLLHLFCMPLESFTGRPLVVLSNGVPILYYLGWLSAICAPTYCVCSGYAHFKQGELGRLDFKRNLKRFFKFMVTYWLVVVFITCIGIILKNESIPGSVWKFLSNFFVLSWSYNGIWWYVYVYAVYVFVAPILYRFIIKVDERILIILLIVQFLSFEGLHKIIPMYIDNASVLEYIWWHIYYLFGARLLCYSCGMLIAKRNVISYIKNKLGRFGTLKTNLFLGLTIVLSSVVLCITQKGILLVFYSIYCFIVFNSMIKGTYARKILLILGKYSTYIWLLHPFIYTETFMIFYKMLMMAEYSILIMLFLLIITIMVGYVLDMISSKIMRIVRLK